jgi:hypothetical protein
MDSFITWLKSTDFFVAPASTRFHRSEKGGLAEHSYEVFKLFKERTHDLGIDFPDESIMITAFLHDLCKTGLYIWESTYWKCNYAILTAGHGIRSIKLLENHIELTPTEKAIIKYHMGPFGAHESGCKGAEYSLKSYIQACNEHPIIGMFHACDNDEAKWKK